MLYLCGVVVCVLRRGGGLIAWWLLEGGECFFWLSVCLSLFSHSLVWIHWFYDVASIGAVFGGALRVCFFPELLFLDDRGRCNSTSTSCYFGFLIKVGSFSASESKPRALFASARRSKGRVKKCPLFEKNKSQPSSLAS